MKLAHRFYGISAHRGGMLLRFGWEAGRWWKGREDVWTYNFNFPQLEGSGFRPAEMKLCSVLLDSQAVVCKDKYMYIFM